jgi:beclin 1
MTGCLSVFYDRIVKDKIGDVSVKLQFSQEDAWTRALRHVLLALKILLKWATSGNNA